MDADERAGVLISALRQAHARVVNSPDDSPETLKVFLAPEFFFRGPTPYRVPTASTLSLVVDGTRWRASCWR